jgi:hypothetical protein
MANRAMFNLPFGTLLNGREFADFCFWQLSKNNAYLKLNKTRE